MEYILNDKVSTAFLKVIELYGKRLEEHTYYTGEGITTIFRYKVYDEEYLVIKENGECIDIINMKELTENVRKPRKLIVRIGREYKTIF